jgi:hypothetical protein
MFWHSLPWAASFGAAERVHSVLGLIFSKNKKKQKLSSTFWQENVFRIVSVE